MSWSHKTFLMKQFLLLILFLLAGCASPLVKLPVDTSDRLFKYHYSIDLNQRSDDLFHVILNIEGLGEANNTFNFAAVYPGSYTLKNMGRFVRNFVAYDASGTAIETRRLTENQWALSNPADIREIRYSVAETWDTPMEVNPVAEMGGTSLESDFVFISGAGVFGYVEGLRKAPIRLELKYPSHWKSGTALMRNFKNHFIADSYDQLVDSPILLGELSYAAKKVFDTDVYVYSYAKTGQIRAKTLLKNAEKVIQSATAFLPGLSVPEHTFLFMFEDKMVGALEHTTSSAYVLKEGKAEKLMPDIRDVMAHEYFHLVTPLSMRSEAIAGFDFLQPQPTEHLWFFEGVTEWASHIMQLRSGLKDMEAFFTIELRQKMLFEMIYAPDVSLSHLSRNSYLEPDNVRHVYTKGAIAAMLLDIRILELSGGQKGLREVVNTLRREYDRERPFQEAAFFDLIVRYSFPEIRTFIEQYIIGNAPLPVGEYLAKIGMEHIPHISEGEGKAESGIFFHIKDEQVKALWADEAALAFGIRKGDVLKAFNNREMNLATYMEYYEAIRKMPVGKSYRLTVEREGTEIIFPCEALPGKIYHAFRPYKSLTSEQIKLKNAWLKNL